MSLFGDKRNCVSIMPTTKKHNDLFHYTSTDAFVKMLEKKRKDKSSDLTFWASNIHYMNDPHEMEFLYDELNTILPELESELGIDETPFSAFDFSKNIPNGLYIDFDNDFKGQIFNNIFKSVYAISFSGKEDYLPMWSLYGNNGGGICLKFDYRKLKLYFEKVKKEDITKRIIEIKYDIKNQEIWPKIMKLYKEYHTQINVESGQDPFILRRKFISRVLLEFCLIMKHHSYSYEEEIRLIDHAVFIDELGDYKKNVKVEPLRGRFKKATAPNVRVKNGLLIPYKEINLPVDCLTSVIVGPTVNSRLQCEAMEILLKRAKLNIEVIPSSVPFRLL